MCILIISDNFRFLYDWCVDTDLSDLYDFICPYYIAHVAIHEDKIEMKARYVLNTLQRGAQATWLYFVPYNTG